MMSWTDKLRYTRDVLKYCAERVYHYRKAPDAAKPYIIWYEDGESNSFSADNAKKEQTMHGYVHLYTKTEFDPLTDDIQDALQQNGIGWALNSCQYEEETETIHYEWEFWI